MGEAKADGNCSYGRILRKYVAKRDTSRKKKN